MSIDLFQYCDIFAVSFSRLYLARVVMFCFGNLIGLFTFVLAPTTVTYLFRKSNYGSKWLLFVIGNCIIKLPNFHYIYISYKTFIFQS